MEEVHPDLDFIIWLPEFLGSSLNGRGVPAPFSRFNGFIGWLIALSHCPCNNRAPDPVACLGDQGVEINADIPVVPNKSRPRARRRRSRVVRGRSTDPSDGEGGPRSSPDSANLIKVATPCAAREAAS